MVYNIAELVASNIAGYSGDANLYRLSPPMHENIEYVLVSAVNVSYSGPETYIFPSNALGVITDYAELSGSFRGDLDHEQALLNAGYIAVKIIEN